MMFKAIHIAVFLCVVISSFTRAQFLQIDAIEFVTIGTSNDHDFGSYQDFVLTTRSPALYRSDLTAQPDNRIGTISNTGFALDFVFVQTNEPVNEFYFGIQSGTVVSEIYKGLVFQADSNSFSSDITNTSQYFTLRTGYQRVFRVDKRIRIVAGNMLQVGIPVSSRTTQSSYTGFGVNENNFFAKQSATLGYTISYGIRFRLFRNIHTAIMSRPTIFIQRVDGTPSTSLLRGTNLSFQFKIQPK